MRPETDEYAPYYQQYIDKVVGEDILLVLDKQLYECLEILKKIPKEKENYSYAPGKWTVKEVIEHITDAERIYSYRALRISRNDKTPIHGFEQDDYVKESNVKNRSMKELVAELDFLRRANIIFFRGFSKEMLTRTGTANNNKLSVRAILFVVAGHMEHHLRILQERYLS